MSDINQKRAFVSDLYSGPDWKKKVAKMADDQVIAIYLRAQNKPKRSKSKPVKESDPDDLTLF